MSLARPRMWLSLCAAAFLTSACGSGPTAAPGAAPEPAPPTNEDPCPKYENTYDAIQAQIFDAYGCTGCHGENGSGDLDLRPGYSHANLHNVPSSGSPLKRIDPGKPTKSHLLRKLTAATNPDAVNGPVPGGPMPPNSTGIREEHLEALRLFIGQQAPEKGAVPDEFGGNRIADLLGSCLPPPEPILAAPLPELAPDVGIAMNMPPVDLPPASETEGCFAWYYDFRERIPPEFMTPDREHFYANGTEGRSDPNTHHLTTTHSGFYADMVDAPEYGRWSCGDGPLKGQDCDPLDPNSCGDGFCRTELASNVACIGYGPPGGNNGATPDGRINTGNGREGFFSLVPTHGILHINPHFFNLTPEPLTHHSYQNVFFAKDRRFQSKQLQDVSKLGVAAGTPPFTKREYCADYVLPPDTEMLGLLSHTHKRGEVFRIFDKANGELLYETYYWEDPDYVQFWPPRVYDSLDPADRTLEYCAVYNNGVRPDGTADPQTVTRLSLKPDRSTCVPVACAEGRIGEACDGPDDHATCDSEPGAADGFCDACVITRGLTSDDEMFVLIVEVQVPNDQGD